MIRVPSGRRPVRRRWASIARESRSDPRSRVGSPRLRAARLCSVCVMAFKPSRPSVGSAREEEGENPHAVNQPGTRPPKQWRNARGTPVHRCRLWRAKTCSSMGARPHFRSRLERSDACSPSGEDGRGLTPPTAGDRGALVTVVRADACADRRFARSAAPRSGCPSISAGSASAAAAERCSTGCSRDPIEIRARDGDPEPTVQRKERRPGRHRSRRWNSTDPRPAAQRRRQRRTAADQPLEAGVRTLDAVDASIAGRVKARGGDDEHREVHEGWPGRVMATTNVEALKAQRFRALGILARRDPVLSERGVQVDDVARGYRQPAARCRRRRSAAAARRARAPASTETWVTSYRKPRQTMPSRPAMASSKRR